MVRMHVLVKIGAFMLVIIGTGIGVIFGVAVFKDHQAKKVMICGVSREWNCPAQAIAAKSLGAATYRFSGCGRSTTYYCKMPAEGCRLESGKNFLNTSMCRP